MHIKIKSSIYTTGIYILAFHELGIFVGESSNEENFTQIVIKVLTLYEEIQCALRKNEVECDLVRDIREATFRKRYFS